MPSLLRYLGLFLLALLPLASLGLYSGDTVFSDTSGSELQNEAHAPDHKWLSIAKRTRLDITSVRNEQFKRDFGENASMTEYSYMRIKTSCLNSSDGCVPPDFSANKCLRKIYSDLREYQFYLRYVERENLTKAHTDNIKLGIATLLRLINETGKVNDDKPHPTFRVLPGDSAWTRKIVTHSVLYNMVDFMTDTIRAINYLKVKKLTRSAPKDKTWLSKHEQEVV